MYPPRARAPLLLDYPLNTRDTGIPCLNTKACMSFFLRSVLLRPNGACHLCTQRVAKEWLFGRGGGDRSWLGELGCLCARGKGLS